MAGSQRTRVPQRYSAEENGPEDRVRQIRGGRADVFHRGLKNRTIPSVTRRGFSPPAGFSVHAGRGSPEWVSMREFARVLAPFERPVAVPLPVPLIPVRRILCVVRLSPAARRVSDRTRHPVLRTSKPVIAGFSLSRSSRPPRQASAGSAALIHFAVRG
jgi:hypothetical protein